MVHNSAGCVRAAQSHSAFSYRLILFLVVNAVASAVGLSCNDSDTTRCDNRNVFTVTSMTTANANVKVSQNPLLRALLVQGLAPVNRKS